MQMNTFNQHQLRSCIEDQSNFNNKYSYFKTQFQHSNQEWIHKSIRVFKSILIDNQSPPFRKIQALKVIRQLYRVLNKDQIHVSMDLLHQQRWKYSLYLWIQQDIGNKILMIIEGDHYFQQVVRVLKRDKMLNQQVITI